MREKEKKIGILGGMGAEAGADFICLPCNTAHFFLP